MYRVKAVGLSFSNNLYFYYNVAYKYGPVLLEIDILSIYSRLIKSSNLKMLLHTTTHLYTHFYLIYFQ